MDICNKGLLGCATSECKGQFNVPTEMEHIHSYSSVIQLNNIEEYIHFYIKFIIFCKVYINRLHYFCLPFLYK